MISCKLYQILYLIQKIYLRITFIIYFCKCRVTLSLSYDNLFLNDVCGGNHAMAKGRVEKIIKLAQGYFLDSATLGTKITLEIKEIKHTNHEFRLREKLACNPDCML